MEEREENMGNKPKADPVFFLSLTGVDGYGHVTDHESIFDIYTKEYDFWGTDIQVKSSQDLWDFYESQNIGSDKKNVLIYTIVESFVKQNPKAHYIIDECPLHSVRNNGKLKYWYFS